MKIFFVDNNLKCLDKISFSSLGLIVNLENWTIFEDKLIKKLRTDAKKNALKTCVLVPFNNKNSLNSREQKIINYKIKRAKIDIFIFYLFNINNDNSKINFNVLYENFLEKLKLKKILIADDFKTKDIEELDTDFFQRKWKVDCLVVKNNQKSKKKICYNFLNQNEIKKNNKIDLIFSSKIVKGKQKGREIGFPTINLIVSKDLPLEKGVYACEVNIAGIKETLVGAGCYWNNELNQNLFEIFILNFDKYVYDKEAKIKVIKKIREIKKFSSLKIMQETFQKDINEVQKIIKGEKNE